MKRRSFFKQTAAYISAPAILSARSPNGMFQVASIGVGGMGGNTMMSVLQHPKVRIVGMCDVDAKTLELATKGMSSRRKELQDPAAKERLGDAATYRDYREMIAKMGDSVDAITIGTPDHMHAPIAVSALRAKKHIYLQKPLTHHIHEARILGAEAAKAGVTTQMGTQGHSSVETSLAVDLIKNGAIGKVKEIICWENKKANWWPKVTQRKPQADAVPANIDWDLWLGIAQEVPFLEGAYHPSMWRSWVDFGVGMMGDMGCHYFDVVFACLGLAAPTRVRCLDEGSTGDLYAMKRHLELEFPGTALTAGDTIKMTWTDGGYPYDPKVVIKPAALTKEVTSGIFFIGETGSIFKPHSQRPWLVPEEKFTGFTYPKTRLANHYTDWVDACMKGEKAATDLPTYGCPVTEAVLLGVLAERNPGSWIEWDAAKGQVSNKPELNAQLTRKYRDGWSVAGLG
ncbi:MAG: Gfo/Idh/MocA family oxidoreductase [Verrucomicrobiaceae bacterium]|nr:Gfo/Idh/MocA family oxidoreductase [Verrucomicrobiaceae bacterium]